MALVGRENQSRLLRFTWKRLVARRRGARRGPRRRSSSSAGWPGIGKSALAAELAAHVRLEGGVVFETNCSPYHGNVALWPVGRMLEQLLGFYPDQPAGGPAHRTGAPAGRRRPAGTTPCPWWRPCSDSTADERWARPEVDALALRQQTLQALVTWLAHTAASTPSLVLAEDLHWADPTTVELLGLLATEGVPGTMILITSRDPAHGALGVVGRRHRAGAARGEGGGRVWSPR